MTYRAVVFDFDLTLVDSRRGFVDCYRHAAEALGLPPPAADDAGRMIGTPLPIAFTLLYGPEAAGLEAEFTRVWQQRADAVMTDLTDTLPETPETLRRLQDAGLALGIVSQKRRYRVAEILKRDGLLGRFDAIIGAEDAPALKPDPRGLLAVLHRFGAGLDNAVYVGDTVIDAETARNAGVPFIAVLTGYASAADFTPYAPIAVLDSVGDLPAYLGLAAPTDS